MKNKYCYEYPRPAVTTDCVVFGYDGGELKILLIERAHEPFKSYWALPGGFLDMDEDAETGALRELKEETGITDTHLEQLHTFSGVNRDPRSRVISISHYTILKLSEHKIQAGDDARDAQWFPLSEIPLLAFDHKQILKTAIERLQGKMRYEPIGLELLPEKFTIYELQQLYEAISQKKLDRHSFSKKILNTNLLTELTELYEGEKLYRFNKKKYNELTEQGFYFEIKN